MKGGFPLTKTYDRLAVGERLRLKRNLLSLTQDDMAEKIDRAPKYYADIERGSCGMSIETMLALSQTLNMSLDYMIFGTSSDEVKEAQSNEVLAIIDVINNFPPNKQKYALQMLKMLLNVCDT